jgi:hypothetical protein
MRWIHGNSRIYRQCREAFPQGTGHRLQPMLPLNLKDPKGNKIHIMKRDMRTDLQDPKL